MSDERQRSTISEHDKAVLARIFSPEAPYPQDDDDDANDSTTSAVSQLIEDVNVHEEEAIALEIDAVKEAENGNLSVAIEMLGRAIDLAPSRASGYNNRAQALRLKGDTKGAMEDLNMAIDFCSGGETGVCQAHIQRGMLRRLAGDDNGALDDFQKAANLGNDFARQMTVMLNPYAAMCNQMLFEVIGKLISGDE